MQPPHLGAAVLLGFVVPQISSLVLPPAASSCLAAVDTCMSSLCQSQQASSSICDDEECHVTGSEVCNMTIQAVLEQFPSLRGCVCAWGEQQEEDLCGSIPQLATQCPRRPAQRRSSTMAGWRSSSLIGSADAGAGSCLEQMRVCVSDTVCNRFLAPLLMACTADQCDRDRCQRAMEHFYSNMPPNVADMLTMCECNSSDADCLHVKAALHSGACATEAWICQESVSRCVQERRCRDLLKTFQAKCWSSEEAQCSSTDLQEECFSLMDPDLILAGDVECKTAFAATLGTALHHPCTCKQVHGPHLRACIVIHEVLHNRSRFMKPWRRGYGPSKPPESDESERGRLWVNENDYLLYATVLLVGAVLLMPLAVISKLWLLRRGDKTRLRPPQKSLCVAAL
ncbi:GDNF family receptor alpha-like isoform 2-T2 [Aulostomus maculatus]